MNCVVILAGGIGERLWPKSRAAMPKHLQSIVGEKTMLQQTVDRVRGLVKCDHMYVVTSASQRGQILSQVPDILPDHVIDEPMGKNTAAAVGVAAALIEADHPNAVMIALPSDHYIEDVAVFRRTLQDCCDATRETGALVTIGVRPRYPSTGYGYIQREKKLDLKYETSFHAVGSFKEKPDEKTAKKYVDTGEYYWNSGTFIWKTSVILEEMKKYMPNLHEGCMRIQEASGRPDFEDVLLGVYNSLESVPIDIGIMEKAKQVVMAEAEFDWDDVGSWLSLEKHVKRDPEGNAVQGNFVSIDSSGCIVSGDATLTAAIGVSDLVIVRTDDALLVCPKDRAQDVKELVRKLKADTRLKRYT
jgi:mannose-1-phosphate guanylyltransferase